MEKGKRKKGCLIGIVVFFAICILVALVGGKDDDGDISEISSEIATEVLTEPETENDTKAEETTHSEKTTAESSVTENTSSTDESSGIDENFIRPEFKEAMDSYEAFFNEYVEFMEKFQNATDTASMLAEYADFMGKYADYMEKLDAWENDDTMTIAETAYYLEVSSRIMASLAKVTAEMEYSY